MSELFLTILVGMSSLRVAFEVSRASISLQRSSNSNKFKGKEIRRVSHFNDFKNTIIVGKIFNSI